MGGAVINISKDVNLAAQTIMTGRGCILGQSGSGKSYLAGVILEELCKSKLPFCIVDPEGEYYPLRNAFQVIIVGGDKGDVGLNVDFHALFKSSVQNSIPVILDLSDIAQKSEVLNRALAELYLVEEEISVPYLVVVEETDKFAPQIHHVAGMVEELAVRGRKRGIGLLIVSQRPANVDKNVLAQCSYGLIGKLAIENDLNAVGIFFSRSTLRSIAAHRPGEFSTFGLGIDGTVHVKRMLTVHAGATPRLKKPAAGKKLTKVISELKKETAVSAAESTGNKPVSISAYSIIQGIDEGRIRRYAKQSERKAFGFFGKRVESIDSINKRFISVVLIGLRMPLRHRNEYKEEYLMLDDRLRFVTVDGRLNFTAGPLAGEAKLLSEDRDVLAVLSKGHRKNTGELGEKLGMGSRALRNSINRLKLRKLVGSKGGKVSLIRYDKYLSPSKPALKSTSTYASLILNRRLDERIEKDWARTVFPSAVIFECERVLIPVYEVKLRERDRVRVLTVDAVYGGVLRY